MAWLGVGRELAAADCRFLSRISKSMVPGSKRAFCMSDSCSVLPSSSSSSLDIVLCGGTGRIGAAVVA